jgi:Uma2 family endonuclease
MSTASILTPGSHGTLDDRLFEVVDGLEVEKPPMGALAGRLANRLAYRLNAHAIPNNLGEANVENLFHLALPVDRNRRPDVAYVSRERWPRERPVPAGDNAWNVVPNIAVEAVSPSDFVENLLDRIEEYFRAGVELVWILHPKQKLVYVYESPVLVRALTVHDSLNGGKVLPEFALPLQELFIE